MKYWTDTVWLAAGLAVSAAIFSRARFYMAIGLCGGDDQGRVLPEGTLLITRAAFVFELIQKVTDICCMVRDC